MDNINMHIKKINNFTDEELQTQINEAYKTWNERNKIKWELDFSIITNSGFEIKKSYV